MTSAVRALLRQALAEHGDGLRIACSLGIEDVIVLHEAARAGAELGRTPRVFFLDTGRHEPSTYAFLEQVQERFGLALEVFSPQAPLVERLVRERGIDGFRRSLEARHACCDARKVEPLSRALAGATAWVTGLRREQSPTRAVVEVVARDERGLVKLSPLALWTEADVLAFARANDLPTHPLHAQGYASIGCAPCTRAIAPGEPVRAGRWWWEEPEHKECGLHPRTAEARP